MEINFKDRTMNIPGCSEWTEEKWERFAAAIGATLVPLSEESKEGEDE
jgi:hypothetical protein